MPAGRQGEPGRSTYVSSGLSTPHQEINSGEGKQQVRQTGVMQDLLSEEVDRGLLREIDEVLSIAKKRDQQPVPQLVALMELMTILLWVQGLVILFLQV